MRVAIRKDEKSLDVLQTAHAGCDFEALFETCHATYVNPGIAFVGQRFGYRVRRRKDLPHGNVETGTRTRRGDEYAVT